MRLLNVCRKLLAYQSLHLLALPTQEEDVYSSDRISLQWDWRDRNRQVVSSGVYIYAIRQGPVHHLGKVLFIK